MNLTRSLLFIVLICCTSGCSDSNDEALGINVFSSTYDFAQSQYEWSGGFADMALVDSTKSELYFSYEYLPESLPKNQKSLVLSGNNKDQNLFMFIKKKVTGLLPSTEYTLVYKVDFTIQNYGTAVEGDSVSLKVGASAIMPEVTPQQDGYYRLNIDKGVYNTSGTNMVIIGSVGINNEGMYNAYVKSNSTSVSHPSVRARTNSQGEVWLIVGTDSAFKGTTTVFYTYVDVVFSAFN